jgi:hypothetical protein
MIRQNMDYLKTQFPDFYGHIISPQFVVPGMSVEDTGQPGNFMLSAGAVRCGLHSAYDIDREMAELFRPLDGDDNQVIVIFGLGYGHCLDYLRKKRIKFKRLVIFEPCSNILAEVLKKRHILEILGRSNVYLHLMNRPNDMASFLLQEAFESRTVKMLYHISYMTLFKGIYDNVLRIFRNEKTSTVTSVNTFAHFAEEWNAHQLKSLRQQGLNGLRLAGRFQDVPGIIASAGPSLEKQFELLRQVGDRAVVVAPGSSARILNARDINAHIGMAIDSQRNEARIFSNYRLKSVLVSSFRAHPELREVFPNDVARVVLTSEFLARYYHEWIGEEPMLLDDHASVASSALDLLVRLGCDPIIIIGQDLCFQKDRLYAGDSVSVARYGRTYENPIEDVDIYGNKVYTYFGFKAMQNDMENQSIKYAGRVRIFNATEGGLMIHGVENAAFADMFSRYVEPSRADVSAIMREALAGGAGAGGAGGKAGGSMGAGGEGAGAGGVGIGDVSAGGKAGGSVAGNGGASGRGEGAGGEKSVEDFFRMILGECGAIEKVLIEKERGFQKYDRLKERGVGANRLNSEMGYIRGINRKLNEIMLYKGVVYNNIEQQLSYYRAGAGHITDAGESHLGMELYERKLDEYSRKFTDMLKRLTEAELASAENAGAEKAGAEKAGAENAGTEKAAQ